MTEKHGNIATPDKQFQVCSKYIPLIRVNDLFRPNFNKNMDENYCIDLHIIYNL
jgi:hypothetical protein